MTTGLVMFLCGDVTAGRGIDQILPHAGDPTLFEPLVKDAGEYVELAERRAGRIRRPVGFDYVWGDALHVLEQAEPEARCVNLETSVTTAGDYWRGKHVHYRMHPRNVALLTAAGIDACALANNHVLDWGYSGLAETLTTLSEAGVRYSGAGSNLEEAVAPAVLPTRTGRVLFFSAGSITSGIPFSWAAGEDQEGVFLIRELSERILGEVARRVEAVRRPGDIVVFSIHWGSNWGYEIPDEQVNFAHRLIEEVGVDVVHGHSSHHVKGLEVHRDRLILYGCGDFLNDYEGISGFERYRGDLGLMYFPRMDPVDGRLLELWMIPTRMRRFQVRRASPEDARFLAEVLNREGKRFGLSFRVREDESLVLS